MKFKLLFLFLAVLGLKAQDAGGAESAAQPVDPALFTRFRIGEVLVFVEGGTWELSLRRFLDIDYRKVWQSWEEMRAYLLEKRADLANNRIFAETSLVSNLRSGENGLAYVDIVVRTRDSWNILALPIPKYSDSEGLNLSLRIRDNNFLGTMEQLRINVEYKRPTDGTTALGGSVEVRLPFLVGGDEWFFSVDGSGFYKSGGLIDLGAGFNVSYPFSAWDIPWTYSLGQRVTVTDSAKTELTFSTAMSAAIPLGDIDLSISPSQSMKILTDYADPDGYYATTRLDIGTSIPTGLLLPGYGSITYNPGAFAFSQYQFEKAISFDRSGLYTGVSQALTAGRWDWVENLRQGSALALSHTYTYNFTQGKHDNVVSATLYAYGAFADLLGLSLRLQTAFQQNATDSSKMEPVRGVIDSSIVGNWGLYGNVDVTLKVLRVNNMQDWWGWNWMKAFNFEAQFSVFTDLGYILPQSVYEWSADRLYWTAGIELIGFPLIARSYFMRASYGINIKNLEAVGYDVLDGSVREIFIGLGHHY